MERKYLYSGVGNKILLTMYSRNKNKPKCFPYLSKGVFEMLAECCAGMFNSFERLTNRIGRDLKSNACPFARHALNWNMALRSGNWHRFDWFDCLLLLLLFRNFVAGAGRRRERVIFMRNGHFRPEERFVGFQVNWISSCIRVKNKQRKLWFMTGG